MSRGFFLGEIVTSVRVVADGVGVLVGPVDFSFYVGREIVGGSAGDRDESIIRGDALA
jgi:hypothetical protein